MKRLSFFIALILMLPFFSGSPAKAGDRSIAESVRKTVAETIGIRRQIQGEEDRWAREREKLAAELASLEKERKDRLRRDADLSGDIEGSRSRAAEKERQLREMSRIAREIAPFLVGVLDRLEKRVADDLPFLLQERRERILRLRKLLDDPEAPFSEKFRKVFEACLVEAEYGDTVEVRSRTLALEGQTLLARVLRLGRLSLFCQSLDRKRVGYYDPVQRRWKTLPRKFSREINAAMEIGSRRRPADILALPVGRLGAP